jgi:hypothetical protein
MKVVELTNVVRKETPLHYRRTFTATAVLRRGAGESDARRIEFVLEQSPFGSIDVRVKLLDDIDYPLAPAIAALKEHIQKLDDGGALP